MRHSDTEQAYEEREERRNETARSFAARYLGGEALLRSNYRAAALRLRALRMQSEALLKEEGMYAEILRRAYGIDVLHACDEKIDRDAESLARPAALPSPFDGDDGRAGRR